MLEDPRFFAFLGGLVGTVLSATVAGSLAYFIFRKNRTQNYYSGLLKFMGDHNWNMLRDKLHAGLPISTAETKVAVVCYQHLNLLFYAWLHRDTVDADGSLAGWKNWAKAIVDGAKLQGNEQYRIAYRDILKHGDLYPVEYRQWLRKTLGISEDAFTDKAASNE